MTTLGNTISSSKDNNLNAIRLMLALGVILSHAFPLSLGWGGESRGEPMSTWTNHQESFGSLAVNLFFVISGMLITASWLHSKSMQDFLMRRFLRIYPAFIVAVIFSGAVIWTLCPEFRVGAGWGVSWLILLVKNCFLLKDGCLNATGVFAHNPLPNAANGSLWTIPIEFSCYLLVAWVGLFCLFKHRGIILVAALLVYATFFKNLHAGHDITSFPCRFFTYFMVGMCFWLWRDLIPFSKWLAIACLLGLLVASHFKPWFSILFPIAGAYFTIFIGYGPSFPYLDWTRKTDLSYGTYLYAFPVQQIVAMNESLRNPWLNFALATPVVLVCAWFSWNLVEKHFLAKKNLSHRDFDPGKRSDSELGTKDNLESGTKNILTVATS